MLCTHCEKGQRFFRMIDENEQEYLECKTCGARNELRVKTGKKEVPEESDKKDKKKSWV